MTKKLTVKQVAEQTIQEMLAIGMKKSTIEKGYSYYCFSLRFLSTPIRCPEKIQPAATNENIEAVLNQIDRSTHIGKRDYAMILLGVTLGLSYNGKEIRV